MARFAAATVLVCAALLLCVEQSAGSLASADPLSTLFPANSRPPPVMIYCKQNTELNVAVGDDGKVVLAVAKFGEFKQLWWKLPLPALVHGEGHKFWLVNVATEQAIATPTDDNKREVKMAPFNPWDKAQLWVPDTPDADGFYQIKVSADESKALNGLGGSVHKGTVVGIYPGNPVSANTLWNLTSIWPFPFHYFP